MPSIISYLKPGRVLLLNDPSIDHDKFYVIINIEPLVLLFFINSRIHPFIMKNPDLVSMQVQIFQTAYPSFLSHDSYIACHEFNKKYLLDNILKQIESDPNRIKSMLHRDTKNKIIEVVTTSVLYSEIEKELIINNLS